ncbi:hypothetical protein T06_8485 [Trichinella sp. T6]|nr:hypothetical protein T06_5795 [Trichinella sp. T6]KRX71268.1 hypothetical protein T06_8485 [Trichinella sp. T6]
MASYSVMPLDNQAVAGGTFLTNVGNVSFCVCKGSTLERAMTASIVLRPCGRGDRFELYGHDNSFPDRASLSARSFLSDFLEIRSIPFLGRSVRTAPNNSAEMPAEPRRLLLGSVHLAWGICLLKRTCSTELSHRPPSLKGIPSDNGVSQRDFPAISYRCEKLELQAWDEIVPNRQSGEPGNEVSEAVMRWKRSEAYIKRKVKRVRPSTRFTRRRSDFHVPTRALRTP